MGYEQLLKLHEEIGRKLVAEFGICLCNVDGCPNEATHAIEIHSDDMSFCETHAKKIRHQQKVFSEMERTAEAKALRRAKKVFPNMV